MHRSSGSNGVTSMVSSVVSYSARGPWVSSAILRVSLYSVPLTCVTDAFSSVTRASFLHLNADANSGSPSQSLNSSVSASPYSILDIFFIWPFLLFSIYLVPLSLSS